MKRRRRGGRPRKAEAGVRATTRAGRAPRIDLGTAELRRLRLLLNGRDDLDTTPLSALYGRNLIDLKSYAAGRRYAALNEVIRRAWGLQEGSVADLYRRMVAGTVGDIGTVLPGGGGIVGSAEAARSELALLDARLWLPGEDGARYFAVRALVVDGAWPPWLKRRVLREPQRTRDQRRLEVLQDALERLAEPRRAQKVLDMVDDLHAG